MQEYSNNQLDALGLQIGCMIRVERLRQELSQENLGLMIESNKTTIGRLERHENSVNWKILFKVCQSLKIQFSTLFILQPLDFILSIIKESYSLEDKLTAEKEQYYINLEIEAKTIFAKVSSN